MGEIRSALREADPPNAPRTGRAGGNYTWPDRGFRREEHFAQTLREGLRDNAEGIIARGQNREEADTLVRIVASLPFPRSWDHSLLAAYYR
jgi:hypothetical protein